MFSGVLLLGVLVGAALLGHQRSGKRARARKLARLNGVKVLLIRRSRLKKRRRERGILTFVTVIALARFCPSRLLEVRRRPSRLWFNVRECTRRSSTSSSA